MPILPKQPDIYPPDLLEGTSKSPECEWWAIHTLARREKDLIRRMLALEIPFYCPLVPKKTRSPTGRVRTSYIPLFAGYVFMLADAEQRHRTLTTNCIAKTIPIADSEVLLRDLSQIQQLISSNVRLTQESRIQAGQRVRVITGPFRGIEGVVLKRQGAERLLVSVGFLQQGASVAIEDFQVEAI